ncbi:MAG TPA: phosphatase PAP2 family protein [Acidimicrobiales bacterium]|nr:phosphatase PAP2 family protein [Acidimicrobiales bacterium]
MRSRIAALDARIDDLFATLRGNPIADRLFYTASALGDFGLLWLALGLVRILRGRPGDTRAGLRAITATGIESVVVNAGLKSLFRRRRPRPVEAHPLPFRQPLTSSFPSGHATAAFCAATLLAEGEQRALGYYALATTVALSRIHTKIHHASDVAGGMAIGVALGHLARRIVPLDRATS